MSKVISFFKRRRSKQDSFESLIAPHITVLYRQAYKYLGDEHEAEDLIQELLVDAYQRQQKLREAAVPIAWLMRCLYHRFVDRYRKQKIHAGTDSLSDNEDESLLSHNNSPEKHYLHGQILHGLSLLTPEQRMVVSLHDIEGYTLPELAETMDIPLGTLKSHLHRGRKVMKKRFQVQPFDSVERC